MDQRAYKQSLLDALYAPYKKCVQCPLGTLGRINVVFGQGNPDATLMFIGEGPGQEEDRQGVPFVGRSGALLNKIFQSLSIERSDLFITNIVKCRPPNNRTPTPLESFTCKSLLLINQIKIIRPQIICTLGAAALQGLLQTPIKIGEVRSKIMEGPIEKIPLLPTYHPAYILRNPKEMGQLVADIARAYDYALQHPK
jgi:uracil-DNA glycosylase family 4